MFIFILDLILEEKNISLKELSADTKISESYLSELINNKKSNPTLDILYKVGYVIGENPKDFFFAVSEYEYLQKQLNTIVDKEGINSSNARKVSTILDRLLILKIKNNLT